MFQQRRTTTHLGAAANTLELIYHSTVRNLRKSHSNAVIGLVIITLQSLTMIAVFGLMSLLLGVRRAPIRGDFVLFIMSGAFLYMTHIRAVSAVAGSEGPASAMMQHAPMTTAISILANAFSALYQTVIAASVILLGYHLAISPVVIDEPVGVVSMYLLAWAYGVGVGLIFLSLRPWMPTPMPIIQRLYIRMNMVFSGKMVVANSTPFSILMFFTWNPLFHLIDQCRGFMFINYVPMKSNLTYPVSIICVVTVVGLMWEFFTRKHASKSWNARS